MVFQNDILAGSSGGTGTSSAVHTIDQSIRFNDNDSPYMSRTPSSASNRKTWTWSAWCKRGHITDSDNGNMFCTYGGGSAFSGIRWETTTQNDTLFIFDFNGSSFNYQLHTTQVFRDPSAFYHIFFAFDSTQSVSSERARLYINGQRVTDFRTESYPSLNYDSYTNNNQLTVIGASNSGSYNEHLDGYLAEIVFIDGQALDPSSFGLYNDSKIWIPRDVSSLSFGSNGFHLKGESASDLGNDSSSNNNDFTTSGLASHDQMVGESPTNNFCVMNPLADYYANHTLKNGNLELLTSTTTSQYTYSINNIGMSSGKWYAEMYVGSIAGQCLIGISDRQSQGGTHYLGGQSYEYSYYSFNGQSINGGTQSSYGNTYTTGDIIGIALDLDNNKLYFSKNGTFQNSGDPTSGSTGTGAVSITAVGSTQNGHYFFAVGDYSNSGQITVYWNFGQEGTFAGNTTAGGNSDGNGIGNFKYSVPSGYLALCTKNLGAD